MPSPFIEATSSTARPLSGDDDGDWMTPGHLDDNCAWTMVAPERWLEVPAALRPSTSHGRNQLPSPSPDDWETLSWASDNEEPTTRRLNRPSVRAPSITWSDVHDSLPDSPEEPIFFRDLAAMAPSRLSTSTFTTFSLPGQPIPLSPAHLIAPAAEAASVFDYNVLHQDEDGDIPEEIFQADDGIDLEEDGSQTPHLLSRSWGHKSKAMLPTLSSYPLSAVFRRCFESRLAQLQAATLDANGQPGRSVSRGRTGQQVDGGWYTLRDGETVTIGELKDGDDDDIGSGRELAEAVSRTITGQVDGVDDLGEPEGRAFRLTSSRSQKRRPQKEITFLLSEIESCEEMIEQLQLVIPLGR